MSKATTQREPAFGVLFRELLDTRRHYETLRIGGAPYVDRSELLDRLHDLRAQMAAIRNIS